MDQGSIRNIALLPLTPVSFQPSSAKRGSQTTLQLQSSSSVAFTQKLEKHLDDYRKGRGYLSDNIASELELRAIENSELLARSNPRVLMQANYYSTALGYSARMRYLNGLNGLADLLEILGSANAEPLEVA